MGVTGIGGSLQCNGHTVDEDAAFCAKCGTPLTSPASLPVEAGDTFCKSCRSDLAGTVAGGSSGGAVSGSKGRMQSETLADTVAWSRGSPLGGDL